MPPFRSEHNTSLVQSLDNTKKPELPLFRRARPALGPYSQPMHLFVVMLTYSWMILLSG